MFRSDPPLIAVAHGSRDPRSAATMHNVVELVRRARPDLDIRLAFLDLNAPSVDVVLDAVAAEGHARVVVVPLLLGDAFHARVDLPGMLAAARARHPLLAIEQSDVLGVDPVLVGALRERVLATGVGRHEHCGIAVAAVGSSSARANRRTQAVADAITVGTAWSARLCFATTAPSVTATVEQLYRDGVQRVVVAPWFLAPGTLTDRLVAAVPGVMHSLPIGAHSGLAEVIVARYGRVSSTYRAA